MSIALGLALIATANVGYWYWHTSRTPKVDNTPWKDRYALIQAQHEKELE